jgi:hypothetical protein
MITRLLAWNDALRFLWNLANEQRRIGYGLADKRYPTAFDQNCLWRIRHGLPLIRGGSRFS